MVDGKGGNIHLTIAFDVDDVVADLMAVWLADYNAASGDNLQPEDIDRWELSELVKPGWKKHIYDLLVPEMYQCVRPVPGALVAVNTLRALGHRIVFASSCAAGTADAKSRWLVRHGFLTVKQQYQDFLAVSDKSLVRADFLFDDRILNVEGFCGMGVLFNRPHNSRHATCCHRVSFHRDFVALVVDYVNAGMGRGSNCIPIETR